jgi:hypothetical protein
MRLLIFILTLCLFQPSLAFAQSAAKNLADKLAQIPSGDYNQRYEIIIKAIRSFEPLTKGCAETNQYKELFEIAPLIKGADTQEYLGEINGLAIMKCPQRYLSTLNSADETEINSVVNVLGISPPPWEIAEAVFPYLDREDFKPMMDKYFRKWVLECTHPDGKAKVQCNWSVKQP